jgi:hypothetical protein
MWIFFIFRLSKIHVSPTGIVSSHSLPQCCLSSTRHHHASFSLSQDEITASTSSSSNALSHRLPSQADIEALNLHHRLRLPSLDHSTSTLYCYKKIISTLATLPTTQPYLHFAFLARAPHHRSSTCCRCSLSPLCHAHHPSA